MQPQDRDTLSHADRSEGYLARYKAGLCGVLLGQNAKAAAEFAALKDTSHQALEAVGLTPEVAGVTMRPENTIELTGDDAARMQKLLDVPELAAVWRESLSQRL